VKIYRNMNRGRFLYTLSYWVKGERKRATFAEYEDAKRAADAALRDMNAGRTDALELTNEQRNAFFRASELLPPGVALETAAAVFAESYKILRGLRHIEAAHFFAKKNPIVFDPKPVADAVAELVAQLKADGRSEAYTRDVETRLNAFAESFHCDLADVTVDRVNEFLRNLKSQGRSRNNYRKTIATLFRFAEAKKFVAKDHLEMRDVAKATEPKAAIQIFTPEEITKLLAAAQSEAMQNKPGINTRYADGQGLLPLLVLGGFAGMRTAEVQRQKWSDIHLFDAPKEIDGEPMLGQIQVTGEKGGTAQNRFIPIQANLAAWLAKCKRIGETCCDYARIPEAIARLAERAKVEWKHNGLRHSYISYRVAQTQDVAKVALEAGNSERMIFKHYRRPLPANAASDWFSIVP
jgi:site-specific recombinase XerD